MFPAAVMALAVQAIPVSPLRIERGAPVLELRGDGTIADARGSEAGRIEDGDLYLGQAHLFRVDAAGDVHSGRFDDKRHFDDNGALVFEVDGERRRYVVADDGTFAIEDASGLAHPIGLHVTGITPASRRAAILLGLAVLVIERDGWPPRPYRTTISFDLLSAFAGYAEIVSELRLDRRLSLALHTGAGVRDHHIAGTRSWTKTPAWEIGVEPRWYPGLLGGDMYLAWSTRFARTKDTVGFDSLQQAPPGLSTGALLGFKLPYFFGVTPDFSAGALFPLAAPASEGSHPVVSLVMRAGIGYSF